MLGSLMVPLIALGTTAFQQQADSGKFVLTQTGTQIGTEQYARTATSIEGEMRVITGQRVRYSARLENGIVVEIKLDAFAPSDTIKPLQSATVRFEADSLKLETIRQGAPAVTRLAAPRGTVPYLNPSVVWMQEVVRNAKTTGATSVSVAVLSSPQQVGSVLVNFSSPTAVTLTLGEVEIHLKLDDRGRVLSGEVPSQGVTIARQ